jgi:hypothetical protein
MRKQISKLSVLLAFAALFAVATGCKFWTEKSGGNTGKTPVNSDVKKSPNNDEKTSKSGLAGEIVGTWKGNPDREEEITMTFKENGSFSIVTDDGEEKSTVDAKYRVVDEKTVEIQFDGGKTSKMTEIKISGDTMQANGKNGRPGTFKRVG